MIRARCRLTGSADHAKVAIIGAGRMGRGLVQVFASSGHPVSVYGPRLAALDEVGPTVARIARALEDHVVEYASVTTTTDLATAVAGADLIIEAGPECLATKTAIFAALVEYAPAHALLATTTSSLRVSDIAAGLPDPQRVVGTHFWNPPHAVRLVEVIQADHTGSATMTKTIRLLRCAALKPVRLNRDVPGAVGNRLQHALKREAIALIAGGVCDAETIDAVVRFGFGQRMAALGPMEQSDLVGLDLTAEIHRQLMPSLDNTGDIHPYLLEKLRAGDLGMKSGRGFREWTPRLVKQTEDRLTRLLDRHPTEGSHHEAV